MADSSNSTDASGSLKRALDSEEAHSAHPVLSKDSADTKTEKTEQNGLHAIKDQPIDEPAAKRIRVEEDAGKDQRIGEPVEKQVKVGEDVGTIRVKGIAPVKAE